MSGRRVAWLFLAGCCAVAGGCRKTPPAQAADASKSPYLPVDAAVAAVTDVAPVPVPAPEPETPKVHPAAKERPYPLKTLDDLATSPAAREVLDMMTNPKRGSEALDRLRGMGKPGLDLVRSALMATNRDVRIQAALLLGNLKDSSKETVKALVDAVLLDPDPDARATAARVFVVVKAPEALVPLVRSVREDPFEGARANAAWALGSVGGAGAIQPLREALKDPDTWVRLRAVSSLKKLKARVAVPDLLDHFRNDANPMVRDRAREALKDLTGKEPK